MADKQKNYKYCIVPKCRNTTLATPNKLFFSVPKDGVIRRKWCSAIKRDNKRNPLSTNPSRYCCEDHFDLEEDMENYWQYKLLGNVQKKYLKKGVLPHKFECQKSRLATVLGRQSAAAKRRRLKLVKEAELTVQRGSSLEEGGNVKIEEESSFDLPTVEMVEDTTQAHHNVLLKHPLSNAKSVQVQVRPHYRSKSTMTSFASMTVALSSSENPLTSTATSPMKIRNLRQKVKPPLSDEARLVISEAEFDSDEGSDSKQSEAGSWSTEHSIEEEEVTEEFKIEMSKITQMAIKRETKLFTGLPKEFFFIINMLSRKLEAPVSHILLVLRRIRLNESFTLLAIYFGISTSTASRIFSKITPVMANLMQQFILWPQKQLVQMHLPIPFRLRYSKVTSIIDCLEIEIERPSNAVHQALTWSEYYKCNTLKYLISCTPDGLVNFVSIGFGGRASDETIFKESGFINKVETGTAIMADRGFKNISHLLEEKGAKLTRPPSVSTSEKSTAADVKLTKRIAALRIHIERVIGRLRDFKMLVPHACVDNHLIPIIDYVIIIASGVINLQDHLIKVQL